MGAGSPSRLKRRGGDRESPGSPPCARRPACSMVLNCLGCWPKAPASPLQTVCSTSPPGVHALLDRGANPPWRGEPPLEGRTPTIQPVTTAGTGGPPLPGAQDSGAGKRPLTHHTCQHADERHFFAESTCKPCAPPSLPGFAPCQTTGRTRPGGANPPRRGEPAPEGRTAPRRGEPLPGGGNPTNRCSPPRTRQGTSAGQLRGKRSSPITPTDTQIRGTSCRLDRQSVCSASRRGVRTLVDQWADRNSRGQPRQPTPASADPVRR